MGGAIGSQGPLIPASGPRTSRIVGSGPVIPSSGMPRPPLVMRIPRPPLLHLGGEPAFAKYQVAFDQLFPTPVRDVRGFLVEFPEDSCHHVCYVPPSKGLPRTLWDQ